MFPWLPHLLPCASYSCNLTGSASKDQRQSRSKLKSFELGGNFERSVVLWPCLGHCKIHIESGSCHVDQFRYKCTTVDGKVERETEDHVEVLYVEMGYPPRLNTPHNETSGKSFVLSQRMMSDTNVRNIKRAKKHDLMVLSYLVFATEYCTSLY